MKKQFRVLILLVLFITSITIFISENEVKSKQILPTSKINLSSEVTLLNITNFENFTIYEDDPLISSENTGSQVDFNYYGGLEEYTHENYILHLNKYGNCTYFEIFVSFNYTMAGIADQISFKLVTASYYDYLGNYLGITDLFQEDRLLNNAGIWDAWGASGGKYVAVGYPYDIKDRYETAYGSIGLSGDVTEHLVRNESGLYSELYDKETGDLLISHYWSAGISKPVNYLILSFSSGITGSFSELTVYDLNATLYMTGDELAIDCINPSVSIIAPSTGTIITSENVAVVWSGYDLETGLNSYYVRIDGSSWIDVDLATMYIINGLANGKHIVEVKAVDNSYNYFIANTTFTIDLNGGISSSSLTIPGFSISISISSIGFICFVFLIHRKKKG